MKKKLTLTVVSITLFLPNWGFAQIIDFTNPPAGITIQEQPFGAPAESFTGIGQGNYGLNGDNTQYALSWGGDDLRITLDTTRTVTFDIISLSNTGPTVSGSELPETLRLVVDGGSFDQIYTGTTEIPVTQTATTGVVSVTATGKEFTFTNITPSDDGGDLGAVGIRSFNIPEPSTALLGALGVLALFRRRR